MITRRMRRSRHRCQRRGARAFVEKLRAISTSPVVHAELQGGQHTFDLSHSLRFEAEVAETELVSVRGNVSCMPKEIVSTDAAPKGLAGYSQAVKANGLVFVSGQALSIRPRETSSARRSRNRRDSVSATLRRF
jgi:hypothetical protein